MLDSISRSLKKDGFALYQSAVDSEKVGELLSILSDDKTLRKLETKRSEAYGIRNLFSALPELKEKILTSKLTDIAEFFLGKGVMPVKAIFFDKTPGVNWKVPWHQDLTITVKQKKDSIGFRAWTNKAGVQNVQPPVEILENILTIRLHLDDADVENGALKVIPGSHVNGRLETDVFAQLRNTNGVELCQANAGDVMLMKPLLVHSSSAGTNPRHRRVVHLEFASADLPDGLEWYGS